MSSTNTFYQLLFNQGEQTCLSVDPYGTALTPIEKGADNKEAQFFAINPLHTSRKDANVTAYRNLLFEIDDADWSAEEQLAYVASKGLPFSTAVWSGGKSVHIIVSLTQLCGSRVEYDNLWRRIFSGLDCKPDGTTKNPSRFSRVPNVKRSNGAEQQLLYVGKRVSNIELQNWFSVNEVPEMHAPPKQERIKLPKGMHGILTGWTEKFIAQGAPSGEWNIQLFKSSCDAFRNNYEVQEWCELLLRFRNTLDNSDLKTINSAWDRVVSHPET
jgi:hypothetical protein